MTSWLADLLPLVRSHFPEVVISLLALLLLPKLISFVVFQWRQYFALKDVPCPPDQHFILGHAPRLLADMGKSLDLFTDLSRENKWKALKVNFGPGKYQFVGLHPDALSVIYKSDPKSDEVYYSFLPWLGRGLLTANGPRWARSRRLLTPAFHYDILRPYMKVYAEAVSDLVGLWSKIPEGEAFNAFPYISLLTLDIMLRCTCSRKTDCQITKSHSPYIAAVYELSDLSTKRIFTFHQYFDLIYYMTPDYWKFRKNCKIVHKFAMDIIQQRRAELIESKKAGKEAPKRKYLDFIDILLEAKDEAGVGMTDLEIRAEVDTFMFEGHDTTASGITWTLYNLALHQEHQEICRAEVDAILSQKEYIETDDLKSLVHLKYCIKESMRLFPPVSATGRVLAQPTEIVGHKLPQGLAVATSIYTVHRHPDFWENPDDFDPLRFTPERSKGRHSHAYIPFSAGPRNCIGQEFALNEERVVIANILRHFELSLGNETEPVVKDFLIILRPKGGLHLKLKHRAV